MKRGQISFEYMVLIGFITIVIAGLISVAIFYAGNVRTEVSSNQINEFGNKIISTAEYLFYAGEPSMATITVYLPEGVKNVTIIDNSIVVEFYSAYGLTQNVFPSKVNITGTITSDWGLKKLKISATADKVVITQI
ncbi:hypothetical protein D6829_00930 [Candidatus Pacearchaeota archaeon]|nr:MAG: hypothetical protein D6829_00930 [Candidatus Pacearchaeota archaeon]